MSSLISFGFFAVAEGIREAVQKPGSSSTTYYCFYTTSVQCSSGVSLPAKLQVYSPFNDIILEDNTVVFAIFRAYFLPTQNSTILLDALHFCALPGDPKDDDYEASHLPDCPIPFVIGVGSVPFRHEMLSDKVSKAFSVVCSEFIRDGMKTSTVQYVFHSP